MPMPAQGGEFTPVHALGSTPPGGYCARTTNLPEPPHTAPPGHPSPGGHTPAERPAEHLPQAYPDMPPAPKRRLSPWAWVAIAVGAVVLAAVAFLAVVLALVFVRTPA